jgi:hypothetical protein
MLGILELALLTIVVGVACGLHLAAQGGPLPPERYHLGRR